MTERFDTFADARNLPASCNVRRPDGIMSFEVVGDSMSPTLKPGDVVIVDTSPDELTDDHLYVIDDGVGPLVRRLQIAPLSWPPEVTVKADNEHHEPYSLKLQDLHIIGRVAGRMTRM